MLIQTVLGTTRLDSSKKHAIITGLNEVFKNLLEKQQIVQSVEIDEQTFSEGYNEYILSHMQSVQRIIIHTIEEEKVMNDVEEELLVYLPKLIRGLDSISELFYGEMTNEDWGHFSQLTEGTQWVMQCVYGLRNYAERRKPYSERAEKLKSFEALSERHISELESTLERKDYTAVGDQLKYEWPEWLEELIGALRTI